DKFTFPFFYQPHQLCELAAKELQEHLNTQTEWKHNFGLNTDKKNEAIGKMFGVLVVQNQQNEIGYLAAFSGKLAESNHHSKFVPPVFDILTDDVFFNKGMAELNLLNNQLKELEEDKSYTTLKTLYKTKSSFAACEIEEYRELMRYAKKKRKERRTIAQKTLSEQDYKTFCDDLVRESLAYRHQLGVVTKSCNKRLEKVQEKLEKLEIKIDTLKTKRKNKSAALQQKIFEHYQFLNSNGEQKDLTKIFTNTPIIAGAGECAAPKLLQYAFANHYQPIAMGEFWWGKAPKSELRKEGRFYPACSGKCKPILGHMLKGMKLEDDPLLQYTAEDKVIETLYEDEQIAVIVKPAGLLSIPSKEIKDSVLTRMQKKYPKASGPILAHRLDKLTSGIMLISKDLESHKYLQQQFMDKSIKKRYCAVLEGKLTQSEGEVNLPLAVDEDNRPMQKVDFESGRKALTIWRLVNQNEEKSMVTFIPVTGRTHQLRVHAAHPQGLDSPIVGDTLYGEKAERLMLHAEFIQFKHPKSQEVLIFENKAPFGI
ncbi:MAG: RNA pseudouridine synthase, partial [Bacteroidetes bacterium]